MNIDWNNSFKDGNYQKQTPVGLNFNNNYLKPPKEDEFKLSKENKKSGR